MGRYIQVLVFIRIRLSRTIAVSGHTTIIHHEQNPKFLVYYFHIEDFYKQKKKLAHGTKVIEVTPDK